VLDQEVPTERLLRLPALYKFSQQNRNFDMATLFFWVFSSVCQSLILYFFPHLALSYAHTNQSGKWNFFSFLLYL
jgi:hypothetical protein